MTSRNQSFRLRSAGNELFKKCSKEGLASILQQTFLKEALPCYQRALTAASPNEKDMMASACKNIAKTNYNLFKLMDTEEKEQYHLRECFHYYSKASEHGRNCMTMEWLADIYTKQRLLFKETLERFEFLKSKEKFVFFESLAALVTESSVVYPDINSVLADTWLNEACMALNNQDFKASLHALKEMYRPVEEMKRYGQHRSDLLRIVECFEKNIVIQTARTESLQSIHTGEYLLNDHLYSDEDLNMDLIYTVIDYYKHAMLLIRGEEIELEAMALSHLGKLYDQVLKLRWRASTCFKKSLELAVTLIPRVFTTELWYKVASQSLERFQRETLLNQEEERMKEKQKHLDALKPELDKLREAYDRWYTGEHGGEFLMFVYETFPPKVECKQPKREDIVGKPLGDLERLFHKAVVSYHPDRVGVSSFGMEWKVLTEEITKLLTSFYESSRGCA